MNADKLYSLRQTMATTKFRATVNRLEAEIIMTDAMRNVILEIQRKHDQLANVRDSGEGWSEGNRARVKGLLIIGSSGTGKTRAAETGLDLLGPVMITEGREYLAKIVSIKTPGAGTAGALSVEIITRNGLPITKEPLAKEAAAKVAKRVVMHKPTLLFLDDVSLCAVPIHNPSVIRRETGLVWSIAMGLLDATEWPTPVVMTGLPYLLESLYLQDADEKTKRLRVEASRRFDVIRIPDATIAQDGPSLEGVIRNYCTLLGVGSTLKATDEIGARLVHASNYAYGTALDIARHAVALAFCRDGKKGKLNRDDFAAVLWVMGGGSMEANIFSSSRWAQINPETLSASSFDDARIKGEDDDQ